MPIFDSSNQTPNTGDIHPRLAHLRPSQSQEEKRTQPSSRIQNICHWMARHKLKSLGFITAAALVGLTATTGLAVLFQQHLVYPGQYRSTCSLPASVTTNQTAPVTETSANKITSAASSTTTSPASASSTSTSSTSAASTTLSGELNPNDVLTEYWLQTSAGQTQTLFLPAFRDLSSAEVTYPTVIFAHGNGDLIQDWIEPLKPYRQAGLNVLLVEFRGYGESDGDPSEQTIVADFIQTYDLLISNDSPYPAIDPNQILFHGRSIGGGIVLQVAKQRPTAGLILQSTFTSLPAVPAQFGVPESWINDQYNSLSAIRDYSNPVLILHGTFDRVIAPEQAGQMHQAAPNSQLVFYEAGHQEMTPDGWWPAIDHFLKQNNWSPPPPTTTTTTTHVPTKPVTTNASEPN